MTRLLAALVALLVLLPAPALAATPRTSLPDIENEAMCITCGTALNVSEAPSADREREFIKRQIAMGKTKAQVKAALVDEYGQNVLADPRSPFATLVPVGVAVLALATIALTLRRWRASTRRRAGAAPEAAAAPPALDPADAARLDRDMAAFDR